MGYTILQIVYGISPDYDLNKTISNHEVQELDGFTTYYSGNGPTPMMVGAYIKSINTTNDVDLTVLLDELEVNKLEYINEFKLQRNLVLASLEDATEGYGIVESVVNEVTDWVNDTEPSFKIIWSTS